MHALGEFIQDRLDARGWKQIDLVRASGLTKQVISQLLGGSELRRMIERNTIEGLARGLDVDETVIILKSAEAIGVPVDRLAPIIINEPSDEAVLAMVREGLRLRRRFKETAHEEQPVGIVGQADSELAPNSGGADDDAGEVKVSGGTATSGDLRDPRRRSRGSDETNDGEKRAEHSRPPQL